MHNIQSQAKTIERIVVETPHESAPCLNTAQVSRSKRLVDELVESPVSKSKYKVIQRDLKEAEKSMTVQQIIMAGL